MKCCAWLLQTEKELQSGGEVKELMQQVDELSKRCDKGRVQGAASITILELQQCLSLVLSCDACHLVPIDHTVVLAPSIKAPPFRPLPCRLVKDTSNWNNKKELAEAEQASCDQLQASLAELDEAEMAARVERATRERDEAQEAHDRQVEELLRGKWSRGGTGRVSEGATPLTAGAPCANAHNGQKIRTIVHVCQRPPLQLNILEGYVTLACPLLPKQSRGWGGGSQQ